MEAKPESNTVNIDLRVALVYAVFGGLWILLSDRLLETLITDTATLSRLQTYKGWVFVALSAILIFSLLKRELGLRRVAETGLHESEERYRLLFEYSVDAIIFSLLDGTGYAANPAAHRMFGWSPTEFMQLRRSDITDPSDPRLEAALEERRRTGSFHGELTFVRQDGTKFPAEISSMIFKDKDGIERVSTILRDITERKQAEEGLHRYKLLSVHSRDIILFINRYSGRILEANAAAELAYGYSRDELLTFTISDLRAPEVQGLTADQMAQADIHGLLFETIHIRKDGSRFPAEVSSQGATIGNVRTLMSIIRDVSGRKQAEDELRESEQRFRTLIEQAAEGVALVSEDGTLLEWNQAMEQISGILRVQAVGQPIWDMQFQMMPPEQQSSQALESIKAVFTSVLQAGNMPFRKHVDVNIQTSSGETKFVTQTIFTIQTSRGYRVGSIALDITDRKKAEDAILRNERQMRALVTSMDDIVFEFDEHGTYLNIWTGNESLLARPRSELLGQNMVDILGRQAGGLSADALQRVLQSGVPETIEYPLHVIGGQRWFLARISPIPASDGANRTASMLVRDITERKQGEDELRVLNDRLEQRVADRTAALHQANIELERASHAKDEFLATMSHELRTPLNSILGLSETLLEERRGPLNEYQQKSLHIIEASGEHLLELINDILDLSKIEAGKLDYFPQSVSVDDVCRSSLTFVKSQATKKNITITYKNQSSFARISADARRLKQILVNLLTNAVKFTSENGHVILQVTSKVEQDLIQFSVIDDGVGIAPENLQRLFQPFVQLDSSLSRQYEGTGLGLALVQKLADLHGGSVQVESEVGKGSCFTINLNCKQEGVADSGTSNAIPHLSPGPRVQQRGNVRQDVAPEGVILLAEDNLPNILTIGEYLESHGFEVHVARDGLEALAKAEEFNPDLILMDIQMPAMNGLEAIVHLRAMPRFAATPIIALTALAMPGDRERCLEVGANEYMSKPVGLKMLVTTIHAILDPGEHISKGNQA